MSNEVDELSAQVFEAVKEYIDARLKPLRAEVAQLKTDSIARAERHAEHLARLETRLQRLERKQ